MNALISDGKWKSEDFLNYLTVQQQMATAISTENQAIANYRNALATFEFAKGTIQKSHGVCIGVGPLPTGGQNEKVVEFMGCGGTLSHPLTPAQSCYPNSPPEKALAPAPREVNTSRLQVEVPAMTPPGTPPVIVPIELR